MDRIQFGAAYYVEYLPYDRVDKDMQMMVEAGFTTIRIAESTWSVEEPRPGEYDFSYVDRAIDAAERYGLNVIVGTPTYAVPKWLADLDPGVMAMTSRGQRKFGPRQNMDITNPTYLKYAEGIIRALVSHTAGRKNVIGFQIDNETKHYDVCGEDVQRRFREWMREKYGTVEKLNYELGLNYWSNSLTSFDQLPDPTGTVNGSYAGEFARFQRELARDFLLWQSAIVQEYKRPDQFITQNFDFEWMSLGLPGQQNGYSGGVQPDINHYQASKALTLVGTDIYFPSQDLFTGREIAFGGDTMRPLKQDNYIVLESQAQAFKTWTPYPGQLRLMALSHVASGACGVMYWHWHSLHNSIETYWKGLLSHDFEPNDTYEEAKIIGKELKDLSPVLCGMKKKNRIAVVVSAEALTALRRFPTGNGIVYNDIVHYIYDALYDLNLECDVIYEEEPDWSRYDMLLFPALYTASEELVRRVDVFVKDGGTVFATFRSFFANEQVRVYHDRQPHGLVDCFGMTYNQYTEPVNVTVDGAEASVWMEFLNPLTAESVARYEHKYWNKYTAVTRNAYGKGHAWYLGTMVESEKLKEYLLAAAQDAGITAPDLRWPIIQRRGETADGKQVRFLFNYSSDPAAAASPAAGTDLLTGKVYAEGENMPLADWGAAVILES